MRLCVQGFGLSTASESPDKPADNSSIGGGASVFSGAPTTVATELEMGSIASRGPQNESTKPVRYVIAAGGKVRTGARTMVGRNASLRTHQPTYSVVQGATFAVRVPLPPKEPHHPLAVDAPARHTLAPYAEAADDAVGVARGHRTAAR